MFYYIEPEVAGELGENTLMDSSVHPPLISKLHYQFSGWMGDELLESFPCFIISSRMVEIVKNLSLSGFEILDVEVTFSEEFDELDDKKKLPKFLWLKVVGQPGADDFGIADDHRLVISEQAKLAFGNAISNADLESF